MFLFCEEGNNSTDGRGYTSQTFISTLKTGQRDQSRFSLKGYKKNSEQKNIVFISPNLIWFSSSSFLTIRAFPLHFYLLIPFSCIFHLLDSQYIKKNFVHGIYQIVINLRVKVWRICTLGIDYRAIDGINSPEVLAHSLMVLLLAIALRF